MGDIGVYYEVDSFLPLDERYEFLRNSSYRDNVDNGKGFRIRTVSLKDLGKKWFAFSKIANEGLALLERILPILQIPKIL